MKGDNFMEIVCCFLFMISGGLSFLIYRKGIKDAMSIVGKNDLPPLAGNREEYIPDKAEKEFFSQYSELMNYDFDKAEKKDE